MIPLESDILRKVARVASGVVLRDTDGNVTGSISDSVPMLFVWIEFWAIFEALFVGSSPAPSVAFNRCIETLESDGYWNKQRSGLFVPNGAHAYRALDGSNWDIEAHWPNHESQFIEINGQTRVVHPKWLVLAAPRGRMEKLRGEAHPNTAHVAVVNLFTPYGFAVDAGEHFSIRLTQEKGWKYAALSLEDFVSPSPQKSTPGGDKADLPTLSPAAAAVYEILLELPSYKGMTGPELLDALQERNLPIEQSTLTSRIIPELEQYGIENTPRKGYRIPESKRPGK